LRAASGWQGFLERAFGLSALLRRFARTRLSSGSSLICLRRISACLAHITDLLSLPQHFELAQIMAVAPLKIFRALTGLNRQPSRWVAQRNKYLVNG
jgi:hypothetical protein